MKSIPINRLIRWQTPRPQGPSSQGSSPHGPCPPSTSLTSCLLLSLLAPGNRPRETRFPGICATVLSTPAQTYPVSVTSDCLSIIKPYPRSPRLRRRLPVSCRLSVPLCLYLGAHCLFLGDANSTVLNCTRTPTKACHYWVCMEASHTDPCQYVPFLHRGPHHHFTFFFSHVGASMGRVD